MRHSFNASMGMGIHRCCCFLQGLAALPAELSAFDQVLDDVLARWVLTATGSEGRKRNSKDAIACCLDT